MSPNRERHRCKGKMEKYMPLPIATVIFVSITLFLRFSESTEDFRASQFKRFGTDISLNSHLIEAYSGITLLQCSLYCSENLVCVSINFESFSQRCELLSSTSQEFPSDIVNSSGVWHYQLVISEPTTNHPTTEPTTRIHTTADSTVVLTTRSTTNEPLRQTTSMPDGTTEMTTTTEPTTPTTEQTTEQTSEPTTEPTTEHTTEQTTEQTTKQTTEPTTELTTPGQTTLAPECETITTVTDICDKTFTSECEKVATPNYPNKMPDDFSCGFSIQAPEGQEAQLFFEYFSFENHFSCSYDHLEVYEDLPASFATYRSPKLCGSSANPLVTTNGFIYIHVFTDAAVKSGGMSGRLVFSKICGKIFSTNGQEISSPFYPDPLPVGITEYVCQFRIVAPTGSTVRIEFSFLHMEAHDECIYDRIEFYNEADIATNGEPLATVCGEPTVPTNPVYLTTDSVVVKVISDWGYSSNGFVFTYWFE